MERVSMNDGLEGRDTLAFGLAAGEVAVFVLALMSGYAVLRSGLAGAIAWTLAALLAGAGALLAWGRLAGRPLVEWAVLLAAFVIRTRQARLARLRRRVDGWRGAGGGALAAARVALRSPAAAAQRSRQTGAVVIPLALRRLERGDRACAGAEPPGNRACRAVGFFSLAGGSGRTTLAVEAATILAARCRVPGPTPSAVALLDLAARNPCVGLRLGLPAPPQGGPALTAHGSGLLVGLATASALPSCREDPARVEAAIDSAAAAGAGLIVLDFDCSAGDECAALLRRCDQLLVTLTPTPGGVADAYRSTALLRRMDLRDRVGYVVNRWRPGVDLGEVMDDLGGVIVAEVPDDPALSLGRGVATAGPDGLLAAALHRLATHIEAGGVGSAAGVRWGSHAG